MRGLQQRINANSVHLPEFWIAIAETIASVGSPSQFLLPIPELMAKVIDDAKLGRQHEGAPDHADYSR